MVKEKTKINKIKLWIFFGFVWLIPQIILSYLPENYHWIKFLILIFLGIIILFTNIIDKWLVK